MGVSAKFTFPLNGAFPPFFPMPFPFGKASPGGVAKVSGLDDFLLS